MSVEWSWLLETAQDEVKQTLLALPDDLRPHAERVPVLYESWPSEELLAEGWEDDLLGMFVGDPLAVEASVSPRQIMLFLENLWDFAEEDPEVYREEIRVTYIHEFGHYLGLDEDDLAARDLL